MRPALPDRGDGGATPGLVLRLRELAVALGLVAVAFSQAPGRLSADTKLDLVLDPAGFLGRSLSAWDPTAGFGQLQNQAYGYLFPMGPFFLLGHLAALPGWVVQRLWWSLLLVTAFTGVLRLARLLGVGTHTSRLVAATSYALGPRVLSSLGAISVESWPLALAPWVLVPLVVGARGGSPRRAALASALVVAAVGGVNAAATLAVLPLPLLFLLTRERGRRRTVLAGWWALGVVLATAWWVLPLVVLGRYAFPFLDHIESASVTTSVTSVPSALRGTSHWLAYVPHLGEPLWPAGWWLAVATAGTLATAAVAAAGLAGLTQRRMPENRFLVLSLLLGVVLVSVAYAGAASGPLSGPVRAALDGPLAPFRNVHKAQLLVSLPLSLGLAQLLVTGPAWVRARRARVPDARATRLGLPGARALTAGATGLCLAALLAGSWPALRADLATPGAYPEVPGYWAGAADWLGDRPGGRTLLVPGSAFGDYAWGRSGDDPLQAWARSPWAVRNAVPLGAVGATRLMDAIGTELAAGRESPGLAAALARAGISRVLLRNDLDARVGPDPAAASRATLTASPGLRRVRTFGPRSGTTLGFGLDVQGPVSAPPALEVYAVRLPAPRATVVGLDGLEVLSGGSEVVVGLDRGAGEDPAGLLARPDGAPGTAGRSWLVTDTLRRRALDFGAEVGAGYSPTLPRRADPTRGRPAGDLLTDDDPALQTVVRWSGARSVTASSSAADPFEAGWRGAGTRSFAAFDADPTTQWVSGYSRGDQWVELRWRRPRRLGGILVVPGTAPNTRDVLAVRVETDGAEVPAAATRRGFLAPAPERPTTRLRVVVPGAEGERAQQVSLAEVRVGGVRVREHVVLPVLPAQAGAGSGWLLRRTPGRGDCLHLADAWLCSPRLAGAPEDADRWRRTLATATGRPVTAETVVRARPGRALDRALDRALGYRAGATSQLARHPAARPGAAFDGDLATAWVSTARDVSPTLRLDLPTPVTLTGLGVLAEQSTLRGLRAVSVRVDGQRRQARLGGRRLPRFAPVTGRRVELTLVRSTELGLAPFPLRVEDFYLRGRADPPTDAAVAVGCGTGPSLRIGDQTRQLAVATTVDRLVAGDAMRATTCGGSLSVPAGRTEVVASPGATTVLDTVALRAPTAAVPPAATRTLAERSWAREHRRLAVGAGPAAVLVVQEGANAGWRARTADGAGLRPVRLDGWRQGWLLPAGGPLQVELDFTPGRWHRAGLAVGALLVLAALALAVVRPRAGASAVPPPAAPAAGRHLEALLLSTAVPVLLGGWWGLLAAAAALATWRWAPRATGRAAATALLGAGAAAAFSDAPAGGGPAQVLALLAVALTATSLSARSGGRPLVRRTVDRGDLPGEPAQQGLLQQQP